MIPTEIILQYKLTGKETLTMALDITLYEYHLSRSKQVRWTLLELGLEFRAIEDTH
jgi:hypothetical protein